MFLFLFFSFPFALFPLMESRTSVVLDLDRFWFTGASHEHLDLILPFIISMKFTYRACIYMLCLLGHVPVDGMMAAKS